MTNGQEPTRDNQQPKTKDPRPTTKDQPTPYNQEPKTKDQRPKSQRPKTKHQRRAGKQQQIHRAGQIITYVKKTTCPSAVLKATGYTSPKLDQETANIPWIHPRHCNTMLRQTQKNSNLRCNNETMTHHLGLNTNTPVTNVWSSLACQKPMARTEHHVKNRCQTHANQNNRSTETLQLELSPDKPVK